MFVSFNLCRFQATESTPRKINYVKKTFILAGGQRFLTTEEKDFAEFVDQLLAEPLFTDYLGCLLHNLWFPNCKMCVTHGDEVCAG